MASLNRVLLIGNLGADPELRYTPNNTPVATLSVATTDSRPDKDGNRQEHTEWHRVIVWSKQAENCAKYLAKGRSVCVEGRLQTRSWDDKNGVKRYTTEIVAQNVIFLGGGAGRSQDHAERAGMPEMNLNPVEGRETGSGMSLAGIGGPDSHGLDDIPF